MDQVEESEREKTRERCENWRKYLARGTRREPRAASVKRQFLTVVLIFRSYAKDPAKLTSRELRQWIQYMFYAGVDHIFVYHCYHPREEEGEEKTELKELLSPWIRGGYVSYYDWSKTWQRPFLDGQQVPAYQHCIDKFRIQMEWQVAVDIDEYPFSEQDLEPDFLRRQVSSVASSQPHVAEISMFNYLMLGQPMQGDNPNGEEEWLIARHKRLCCRIANVWQPGTNLVKPIYKLSKLKRAALHHNSVDGGIHVPLRNVLRMSHFWGARLDNWSTNSTSKRILQKTEHDESMQPIVNVLRNCPALDEASANLYGMDVEEARISDTL